MLGPGLAVLGAAALLPVHCQPVHGAELLGLMQEASLAAHRLCVQHVGLAVPEQVLLLGACWDVHALGPSQTLVPLLVVQDCQAVLAPAQLVSHQSAAQQIAGSAVGWAPGEAACEQSAWLPQQQ